MVCLVMAGYGFAFQGNRISWNGRIYWNRRIYWTIGVMGEPGRRGAGSPGGSLD
jgi:hypothetical protein